MFDPPAGPSGRPREGAVLVALFDGRCGVCSRSARLIGERDPSSKIERLDLRDEAAAVRFPSLTPDAVRASMHAIDTDGRIYVGLDAVLEIFGELPRWSWLARLGRLPGIYRLAGVGYRLFARNRLWFNRWLPAPQGETPCDGDACAIDYSTLGFPPGPPPG